MTLPSDPIHPGEGDNASPFEVTAASTPSTNRRRFLALGGLAVGAVMTTGVAAGCGTAQTGNSSGKGSAGAAGRKGAAGDTFFIAGFQWDPPKSFNPLNPSPTWPAGMGQSQLIFESLVRFNMLDGSLQPGLGKELKEVDKRTLEVPLQDGTKWQDGEDLTADDVKFTFDLGKKESVSYSNVWEYLQEVKVVDDRTVQFIAKAKPLNLLAIKNAIAGTTILPQHKFEAAAAKGKAAAETYLEDPVGSGPFKVKLADQTQVVLTRFDGYWGKTVFGTPPMKTITHPIFKSNQDGDLKLESGEIDASQQFTAQIWKMWEDKKKPVGTWLKEKPYYLPGNIPLLQINVKKKGLSDPKVRLAIAYAIDTPNIVATAMSSYSDVPKASLILPTGFEEKYFDNDGVEAEGWKYDPEKAKSILEDDLGATKGSDGIYKLKDGTRLGPYTLITPTGWTDWNTACEIAAKSLKAVGIEVKTQFPQAANVTTNVQNGNFDMACWSASGVSPASPWSRLRDVLDDRVGAAIGKTAFANYTRFSHPDIAGLLDDAAEAADDEARKKAYAGIEKIYRQEVPVIPLMYRPLEFYEFNESTWTNFPTEKNPYAPPQWGGAGIAWMFKIKKAGS
ncbi:ABC transporter substrate-binding protein [Microlunatus soli]|uniref:Peptide/nickel transport system substrate-binding protein n=1 Tax=Microlunatus soli TaxID=630515 RepID=A0A1H1WT23_9ACTN|nr:ABC transporter substrate-binding protein [Microlunatus soli]SDS99770.1 peptide/nickel transport system substrate-binding protein [Microlunatus soli]